MKRICLLLALALCLCGCARSFSMENAAMVTIQSGPEIDEETVALLTEQLASMELRRGQSSADMAGWEYCVSHS